MMKRSLSPSNPMAGMDLSTRTDSGETAASVFADSAVDIEMAAPSVQADDRSTESDPTVFEGTDENVEGYSDQTMPKSLSPISQSLSDKMRQLAAAAWALEQDDEMSDSRRRKIESILQNLEKTIEFDSSSDTGDETDHSAVSREHGAGSRQSTSHAQPEIDGMEQEMHDLENQDTEHDRIDESELDVIHDSLRQTVSSMRLRHQEQRHLHQLTVQKLETVAQHYLAQEQEMRIQTQRIQELQSEMANLRAENQTLGHDNDQLRNTVGILEAESTRKEVAVSAMTSAVAGLEGWIESTAGTPTTNREAGTQGVEGATPTRPSRFMSASKKSTHPNNDQRQQRKEQYTPLRNKTSSNRSSIVKGRGRFRGRYYVDDDGEQDNISSTTNHEDSRSNNHPERYDTSHREWQDGREENRGHHDNHHDTQDLQDGVRAWIRGFRDVEECANLGPYRLYPYPDQAKQEDEWGEFQGPERHEVR